MNRKVFWLVSVLLAILVLCLPALAQPNTWQRLAPSPRTFAMAGNIGDLLFVAGGHDRIPNREVATLELYDPSSNAWYSLTPMPQGRYDGAAAVVDGLLYVIGGWQVSPPLPTPTVYVYDPFSDTWSTRAPFPEPVGSGCGAAAVINRKIYLHSPCNGFSGYRPFFHVYDPDLNSWTRLPDVPSPHAGGVAAALGGKFYLAGGFDGTSDTARVDVYDPAQNRWLSPAAPMPTPRQRPMGDVIAGKLYVAGGINAGTPVGPVVEYDPGTNMWRSLASMPTPRVGLAGAAIGGALYAFGGDSRQGQTSLLEVYTAP